MKIAICEDDRQALNLLRSVLLENFPGCSVSEFTNGSRLIHSLNEGLPDLVLLDIEMPELNGIETARKT